MFSSLNLVVPKLNASDRQLFEQLDSYDQLETKEEKLERAITLFNLDASQTIIKFLARESTSQTAFSYTLWLIDCGGVSLDWIYDVAYTISTTPIRHEILLETIFANSKKLDQLDLLVITTATEAKLKLIKLDEFNQKELANKLNQKNQELAISLLLWFLSLNKIASVDLNYLSEILQRVSKTGDDQPTAAQTLTPTAVPTALKAPVSNHALELTLEDRLIALNLEFGGTEEEFLTRTLDNFLFKKVTDSDSGAEMVTFRPGFEVMQFFSNGREQEERPVKISSTKTWTPGIYAIRRQGDELKVMKLPGNDYFEIFPQGPDPYLRAITIWSMLRQDNSQA